MYVPGLILELDFDSKILERDAWLVGIYSALDLPVDLIEESELRLQDSYTVIAELEPNYKHYASV